MPLSDQDLGRLTRESAQLSQKAQEIRQTLNGIGTQLKEFAEAISTNPDKIVFSNPPEGLSGTSADLVYGNTPTFNFKELETTLNALSIAMKVHEVQQTNARLTLVHQELKLR